MRENNSVIKRIIRTLPIVVLEKHIVKNYSKYFNLYEDEYKMDCFNHLDDDPREMSQEEL